MECVHEIHVDTHTDITPLRPVEGITLPGVSSYLPPGSWLREGWQETLEGNESSLYLQMVPFFPVSIMYWVLGNKTLTPSLSASWSSHMPAATMGTRRQRYITHGLGDTPGEIPASKGHHMDACFKSTKSKKKPKKSTKSKNGQAAGTHSPQGSGQGRGSDSCQPHVSPEPEITWTGTEKPRTNQDQAPESTEV